MQQEDPIQMEHEKMLKRNRQQHGDSFSDKIHRYRGVILVISVPMLLICFVLFVMPTNYSDSMGSVNRKFSPKFGSRNYAVIFDAGSSGSRVHVFCFDQHLDLVPIGDDLELFLQKKPGLSAFASDPASAAKSLQSLLEKAEDVVPMDLRSNTPVRVGATAGLRQLGGNTSDKILQAVRDFLKRKSSLKSKGSWVTVLDGSQEGAYQWTFKSHKWVYKIMAKLLAERLKRVVSSLVNKHQMPFKGETDGEGESDGEERMKKDGVFFVGILRWFGVEWVVPGTVKDSTVAINYLLGNLGRKYSDTVGVVDLGGGSVQMAYAISESDAQKAPTLSVGEDMYVQEMYLKGAKYYLYVHSYLRYGLLAARAEILKVTKESGSPCILTGHHGIYPSRSEMFEIRMDKERKRFST
ncbi:hypothetical protein H5410_040319 [Solanum commersonii]|uniref:Apyrase n=1 Tax=Solanum commersonii TaxID=4109 RepID=A0A9J5XPS1_SOLCO|nr:hypothetical protein H5410_040319 [Solanum commersonii]